MGDMGVHSLGSVTGHEFAFQRLQTVRLSVGVNGAVTHVDCFCRSERDSDARGSC